MAKKLFCLLIALLMVSALILPVVATEEEETEPAISTVTTVYLNSPESLLTLAQNCILDSYSLDLQVELLTDIDMTGYDFTGIPIFCGSFEGNNHAISGLALTQDGSAVGLFRYLSSTALVQNLHVSGTIAPEGSRCIVGGIAGENAGKIENCTFDGSVTASDKVGGIVGINRVTGVVDNCTARGQISGDHFTGGIAGENLGVIRRCINSAPVNITPQENAVVITDITLESMTSSESASTVTDVGGIAGTSAGVIRDCDNFATIGYRQIGYNIGGIAGSQMGYIVDCQNFGEIFGRKEVGGIVGQLEPATLIEYTTDALQILQQQLDTMGALAGSASAHAQSSAGTVTGEIASMQDNVQNAMDAVNALLPGSGGFPDADSLQAAQNTLSSSFSGMQSNMQNISSATQSAASALASDMQALMGQIGAMGETLKDAQENIGGSVTDISDLDTPEDTSAKVENCTNYAGILADLNVGGIAGAIAPENDLDPEEDVQIIGEASMNFDSELRAVITDCENNATVTVRKQGGGGIAGAMALGLVKNCTNAGTLDGSAADYVGGITGQSFGFIRQSYANCALAGSAYVGGIAGSAKTLSDCRAIVQLTATEKSGALMGFAENREEITGNYYLAFTNDPGAIDGVSYDGIAQGLDAETFLALENLPSVFHRLGVTFIFEDGSQEQVFLIPGEPLDPADIPEIPQKEGYSAAWEGLDNLNIAFDTTVKAVYTPYPSVMESDLTLKNGRPQLLVEGVFLPEQVFTAQQNSAGPELKGGERLVGAWNFHLPESIAPITLRCHIPDDTQPGKVLIFTGAVWQETTFHTEGSYVVIDVDSTASEVALVEEQSPVLFYVLAAALLVIAIAVIVIVKKKKA